MTKTFTTKQREQVTEWVKEVRKILLMQDRGVELEFKPRLSSGRVAESQQYPQYGGGIIYIGEERFKRHWEMNGDHEAFHVIIHEMTHLALGPLVDAAAESPPNLKFTEQIEEMTVEQLSYSILYLILKAKKHAKKKKPKN